MVIDVGKDFYPRLANRDRRQGDGKHNAIQFRAKYLDHMDNREFWARDQDSVTFDFKNVEKIGPSFANEAFAYFTKYAEPKKIKSRIEFVNISEVDRTIIEEEIDSGYSDR
jgi:hypothetical protein